MRRRISEIIGFRDIDLFEEAFAQRAVNYDLLVLKNRTKVALISKFKNKTFLIVKFIVVNGGDGIGGIGIELPESFELAHINGTESGEGNVSR